MADAGRRGTGASGRGHLWAPGRGGQGGRGGGSGSWTWWQGQGSATRWRAGWGALQAGLSLGLGVRGPRPLAHPLKRRDPGSIPGTQVPPGTGLPARSALTHHGFHVGWPLVPSDPRSPVCGKNPKEQASKTLDWELSTPETGTQPLSCPAGRPPSPLPQGSVYSREPPSSSSFSVSLGPGFSPATCNSGLHVTDCTFCFVNHHCEKCPSHHRPLTSAVVY